MPNATLTGRRTGRKPKPFVCPWNNETIDGLYRKPDGRWRMVATGREFREADERTAVTKFRQWQQRDGRTVEHVSTSVDAPTTGAATLGAMNRFVSALQSGGPAPEVEIAPDGVRLGVPIDSDIVWGWFRQQLLGRPDYVATVTGIPQLANFATMPIPRDPLRLEALIVAYEGHAACTTGTKRKVRAAWDEMVTVTSARTLADLTTERLLSYADKLKSGGFAPETIDNRFTRVKTVIGFGLKRAMDEAQITSALNRCKVLVSPPNRKSYNPTPIMRDDFHKLLSAAKDDALLTVALLFSLNTCSYAAEAMDLDWSELNLESGTYLSDRNKTGVIRAAVLWPVTLNALQTLKRTPGKVFKSSRGSAYHPNSFRKLFAGLRTAAGVSPAVEFNTIRDGAYTSATAAGVPFALVQIMAGHATSNGESDHYIARNPKMVKPATDAVFSAYFA